MSRIQSRRAAFRPLMSLGLVLIAVFLSGCEVLATEGARDAIAGQREVRALEDAELGPLEQEMNDLFVMEIQPREASIEDLRYQLQVLEEEVLRPLWDAQDDAWAPGGDASDAQLAFEGRYRELDLMQRSIDIDQRDLDTKWQNLWGAGGAIDPEFKQLEDLRFEKQRELDRAYRFGNRPIEDIWNQINELNSTQNWGNTDSQIRVEELNIELNRLYDRYNEIQHNSNGNGEASQFEEKARLVQNELDALYNHGWDPINEINDEIGRLENDQRHLLLSAGNDDAVRSKIAELEQLKIAYIESRDAEVAALKAAHAAAEEEATSATTTAGSLEDSAARIAELEQLIAGLEVDSANLLASKQLEIDSLNAQIAEKTTSYALLIDTATADFLTLSESLLADAAALDVQIGEVAGEGGEGAADQVAALEVQRDSLIAQEEAAEEALHDSRAQLESERDAGVVELELAITAVDLLIHDGLTGEIDALDAAYRAELEELRTSDDETVVLISNNTASTDIQASIEASENFWNGLIREADIQILELKSQLGSFTDDGSKAARIKNLQLQASELEHALSERIANLEGTVNELYRQAGVTSTGDSGGLAKVQTQIDAINAKLESIWQHDSSNGLDILKHVQELEKQARTMNEELQLKTRALEEELWGLDDRLSAYYRDQETGGHAIQAEYEAEMALIQQRRTDIDELRWALELEQRTIQEEIEARNVAAMEEIRLIENGQFKAIKAQIRELELELRGFYATQREIEIKMDAARRLIEDKKRELEDNVLDLLETAAGTRIDTAAGVDAAGEPESALPEVDEPATAPAVAD